MARRRKSSTRGTSKTPIANYILIAIAVLAGLFFLNKMLKGSNSTELGEPSKNFSIADYRRDASRYASVGNQYVLEGRVEDIVERGRERLIIISMKDNAQERLPLLLPSSTESDVNVTRGDSFVFQVECQSGRDSEGNPVKGVFVIKKVAVV